VSCPSYRAVNKIQERVLVFFVFLHADVAEEPAASTFRVTELFRVFPQDRLFLLYSENLYNSNEPDSSVGLVTSLQASTQNVKFTLEEATKAQKGSRGIALLFH
jgi:hypothetical protein